MSASDPVSAQAPTQLLGPRDPAVDPMIGREVIGQYRIEKKLGTGGMGAVYLAQQTSVSRPAVIKVLRSQGGGSSEGVARFAVEAKAASGLNHPNIVTIYNYGQMEDGTLFLAMEYIEGKTLAQILERCRRLPADRAVRIATQIASALGEAHAHGVIHRDLKPANVMLVERAGEPDFVKVLDFGIAKIDDAGVTSTGYVVGTPRYMSPEQLLGKRLDLRSDIYSAAIVLYEMLAGTTPFSSDSPIGWMHQHVEVAPKPPSELAKDGKIPPPLEAVVLRALAKAPSDRPPSMEMFALDLVAALNAPTEPPPPPRWRRAARASAHGLVAAVQFLVALAVAFGSRSRALARAAGSRSWRLLRLIGSWSRKLWASGSELWRRARLIRVSTRRSPPAVPRRVAPTPIRPAKIARESARSLLASPWRRFLLALAIVIAFAGLLAALFPEVRSDFGLGGKDAKRHHTLEHSK